MEFDSYYTDKKTMDVRVKLILFIIFLGGALTISNIKILLGCLVLTIILMTIIKTSVVTVLKRYMLIIPLMGILFLSIPFQIEGTEIFSMHIFTIKLIASREGLIASSEMILKSFISVNSMMVLNKWANMNSLLKGLSSFGIPTVMIEIIFFTIRYLDIFQKEFNIVYIAQKSRGIIKGKSLLNFRFIKQIANIIGVVFIKAIDKSDRIYYAMRSRGYGVKRIKEPLNIRKIDIVYLIIMTLLTTIVLIVDKGSII